MIQQLLLKYRSFLGLISKDSTNRHYTIAQQLLLNRWFGDLFLRLFVFVWFVFQTYTYHLMADRPLVLFQPINWFDHLFMPVFPHWVVWYGVIMLAVFLNFRLIRKGDAKIERIVLGFLILWINCIRWKYEFFSHVGHIMVLYHLVGMFLPRVKELQCQKKVLTYGMAIQWFYSGLLVGYTMSGLWKLIGLVYKVLLKPDQINWLHPLAMKLNSIVGYRDWDEGFDTLLNLYTIHWPWQVAFVLMMCLQIFSVLGAFRFQITPLIALGNILFHLVNVYLIRIEFYLTPIVLLIVFFPYHLIVESGQTKNFESRYLNGVYQRNYKDGTSDIYSGFYGFREYLFDKNQLLAGIFFFPGVSLVLSPFFKHSKN